MVGIITVALPVYASPIAWLAMEGLCRQKTTCQWELIIYEDSECSNGEPIGREFFHEYDHRIKQAGCTKIMYKYSKDRISLSRKWCEISHMADANSVGIILQATDCYSEPNRVQSSFDKMNEGYDWLHSAKGIFYYIQKKQTMLFDMGVVPTGLNMCMSTKLVRQLHPEDYWSSVDHWLITSLTKLKPNLKQFVFENDDYMKGIDTDGHNRISIKRRQNYILPTAPFYKTDVKIEDCLPEDVVKQIKHFGIWSR